MPQKAHLNDSKGDTPKRHFLIPKMSFSDFPILTSVGGRWDRNVSSCGPMPHLNAGFTMTLDWHTFFVSCCYKTWLSQSGRRCKHSRAEVRLQCRFAKTDAEMLSQRHKILMRPPDFASVCGCSQHPWHDSFWPCPILPRFGCLMCTT